MPREALAGGLRDHIVRAVVDRQFQRIHTGAAVAVGVYVRVGA